MTKLIGLAFGFAVIMTLVVRKKPLALAMFGGTLVAGLGTGLGVRWLAVTWGQALIHPNTLELAAMVGCVTLLSYMMSVSGLHLRLVNSTIRLLRSAKLAVMVIPPLIGAMPITGGAIVSAPLIDQPADMLEMSQARRSAVNNVFRHANFFILPFSSSLVLAAMLINLDVYSLIARLAPLAFVIWIVGYWTLVRGAKMRPSRAAALDLDALGPDGKRLTGVPASPGVEFLISSSPIILALVVGFVFDIPFWAAVLCGIALALGLTWRQHQWTARELLKGVDLKLIGAMFGIMSFRAIITGGESLSQIAALFENSSVPLPVLGFLLAFLISTVSANHNTTLGITFPMVLPLVAPGEVVAYATLMFAASFVAYFGSPLHLCQIVTNEHCKVSLPAAVKEAVWVLLAVAVAAWGLFYLYLPAAPGIAW